MVGCHNNPKESLSFLEAIDVEMEQGNISDDLHLRFRIFHKYMKDHNRLGELKGLSLLIIQDKYNYFIRSKGRIDKQELAHKDFLVNCKKRIKGESIVYVLQYQNRTNKMCLDMKIAIDTYDLIGEWPRTDVWESNGDDCFQNYEAIVPPDAFELGLKINQADKNEYDLETEDELILSRFEISGLEILYEDSSTLKIGNI